MPIYEYECHDCRRRVSLLVRSLSSAEPPACPRCGSTALSRLMSRFATVKSEEARLESLAEGGGLGDLDEGDPTSVARFMKKMGKGVRRRAGRRFRLRRGRGDDRSRRCRRRDPGGCWWRIPGHRRPV